MKKALIIVDMQNDYFTGGSMELQGIIKALEKTKQLIKYAREQEHKIYFIQHVAMKQNATFFVPNTKGVELHKDLDIQKNLVVIKNYPNSFRDTVLQKELEKENIQELIICGAMTHMCIDTTVRAGFDLGYKILLASDACATKDLQFKENIIKADDVHTSFMAALGGVFCEVADTKDIVNGTI